MNKTLHSIKRLGLALIVSAAPTFALAQDGDVVARVNGQDITRADVAVAEQIFGPQLENMPADARLSVIVNALIEIRLVADAARAAGVQERDDYKSQMAFVEQQTLRSIYTEQQVAASVTDDAVRAIFDQRVASIPVVKEHRLRHILVASESEATQIIEALDAGRAFADIATERSLDDVSKPNGGDLGFVAEGQIIPEIGAAAAELKPGEYTKVPVRTAFGFHVVLLEESRDRPAPSFEAVAPQIRQSLESAAERQIISGLRATAKVEKLVPDVNPPQADDGHDH